MKKLIKIGEVAERLSMAKESIYNDVSNARLHGRGPFAGGEGTIFHKIGRALRFDWEAIEARLLGGTMGAVGKRVDGA